MIMRVTGEGNAGSNGGPSGDLLLHLRVKEHKIFKRNGNDLHLTLPITIFDAILGKEYEIELLDGTKEVIKVKAGTQFGEHIVLKGKGFPSVNGYNIGNLYVDLNILIPTHLTKEQKETFEKLREESKEHDMFSSKIKSILERFKDFINGNK